ncbi:MAG: NYN domain-containing protein [Chloroflexi bacterium]|nr:NYN domain-containing protein [Chloroflexota bacterium]
MKAEEKGIDVKMALDIVTMAIDDHYDVGVVVSSDTDLRPAIEYVLNSSRLSKKIEVAAWYSNSHRTRLSLHGVRIWCHRLDRSTYDRLADNTDYAR